MILIAKQKSKRIDICEALRGEEYSCPACGQKVIPHKGQIVVHHFKHKTKSSCCHGAGETRVHLEAKNYFEAFYRKEGFKAYKELFVRCKQIYGNRFADILISMNNNQYVAIELQRSDLTLDNFERRTLAYSSANVHVLWLPFLNKDKLYECGFRPSGYTGTKGRTSVERYSIRPWEKWLYERLDSVWYYDPEDNHLWQGIYSPTQLYVEATDFGGGYFYSSKRYGDIDFYGPYPVSNLKITTLTKYYDGQAALLAQFDG